MSNLLLYTVQSTQQLPDYTPIADQTGLTNYFGYRPIFCTPLSKDSLAESWFRIWQAAPSLPGEIIIFPMEEKDCIPMNVVDWCNLRIKDNYTKEELSTVFHNRNPHMTDYIVKEIPEQAIRIKVADVYSGTKRISDLLIEYLGMSYEKSQHYINAICDIQKYCKDLITSGQLCSSVNDGIIDTTTENYNTIYGVMVLTGMTAFLWSIATQKNIPIWYLGYVPEMYYSSTFKKATDLMMKWDECLNTNLLFTYEEYEEMRENFIMSLNSCTKKSLDMVAKRLNINRNDKCFCSSGKKYKHCCMHSSIDEVLMHPEFFLL